MAWQVVKNPDQNVVHIIPLGDFEPHDEAATCRCGPKRVEVENGACDLLLHEPYNEALNTNFDQEILKSVTERTEFII